MISQGFLEEINEAYIPGTELYSDLFIKYIFQLKNILNQVKKENMEMDLYI